MRKIFAEEERTIRPSKSDTSLTDGFVMVDNDKVKSEQSLRKGKDRQECEAKVIYISLFQHNYITLTHL